MNFYLVFIMLCMHNPALFVLVVELNFIDGFSLFDFICSKTLNRYTFWLIHYKH